MLINSTLNYMTDTPTMDEVELEIYRAQLILERRIGDRATIILENWEENKLDLHNNNK